MSLEPTALLLSTLLTAISTDILSECGYTVYRYVKRAKSIGLSIEALFQDSGADQLFDALMYIAPGGVCKTISTALPEEWLHLPDRHILICPDPNIEYRQALAAGIVSYRRPGGGGSFEKREVTGRGNGEGERSGDISIMQIYLSIFAFFFFVSILNITISFYSSLNSTSMISKDMTICTHKS